MYTNELEHLLSNDSIIRNEKWGVISIDKLVSVYAEEKTFLIVNTEPSFMGGKHWIALFKKHHKPVELFDSLANKMYEYGKFLQEFLLRENNLCLTNTVQVQPDFSFNCGKYCYYFLSQRSKGVSFHDIMESFDALNLSKNEKIVQRYSDVNQQV